MAAISTRNSLKGYTYQQTVFALFVAIMDLDRKILSVESESPTPGNFDDLKIRTKTKEDGSEDARVYRVQVKNYDGITINGIHVVEGTSITDSYVKARQAISHFDPNDNNVFIVNSENIKTDSEVLSLPAKKVNGVWIVPLTSSWIADFLDENYSDNARELEILHLAGHVTVDGKYSISQEELPKLVRFGLELEETTVPVHQLPDEIENGITWIVGKPGAGKSHFVAELAKKFPNAVYYRFWVGPQDPVIGKRLQYGAFLSDIAKELFKKPGKFYENEIRDYINANDVILIIDGLDHVENYNVRELSKYVDFVNSIKTARVLVLSRPLKKEIDWKQVELYDWDFDQTCLYLDVHEIKDYAVQRKIYHKTSGYPILVYYFTEHYKKYGTVYDGNSDQPITGINEYYDSLIENIDTKRCLSMFSISDSFLQWRELEALADNEIFFSVLKEFVSSYPYLFKRIENRVALLHDSFNTYLREKLIDDYIEAERKNWIAKIEESILDGNVEYMSRMTATRHDEAFYEKVLHKYADIEAFKKLLESTIDYESLVSFYQQLKVVLEYRPNILSVEEYYSFSLISVMIERNNLIAYEGLVYEILQYEKNHGVAFQDEIYSSGVMWSIYTLLKTSDRSFYERIITDNNFGIGQINDGYRELAEEFHFYDENLPDKEKTSKSIGESYGDYTKTLANYFVRIWEHTDESDDIHKLIDEFLECPKSIHAVGNFAANLHTEFPMLKIDDFLLRFLRSSISYRLQELGYFGDGNYLRKYGVRESIVNILEGEKYEQGSFIVCERLRSVVRLANHDGRDLDMKYINYAWLMLFERNDISVYTLPDALLTFEKLGLIDEDHSLQLVVSAREMSEKGIRLLVSDYINLKGPEYTKKLIAEGKFNDENFPMFILDLRPELLNCFSSEDIWFCVRHLLGRRPQGTIVEYRDIENAMHSKYRDIVLDELASFAVRIYDVYEDSIDGIKARDIFKAANIECNDKDRSHEKQYEPFEYGSISERDFSYIKEKHIDPLTIASYPDGWYHVMPYVEIYKDYDKALIQEMHLQIIHTSMFAKIRSLRETGGWDLLLGNIPKFLSQEEIDVDWQKMLDSFMGFLRMSLIERDWIKNSC